MKKRIGIALVVITLLSAAFFAGAYQKTEATSSPYIHLQVSQDMNNITNFGRQIAVVKVDGCQYIIFTSYSRGGTAMVHKENCENPWHKREGY